MPHASTVPTVLTGREHELKLLRVGLDAALGGRGHLYLVSGVPGVGKTRLLEETAAAAAQRDALVLWSRAAAGDAVLAFAPWVKVLRPLVERPAAVDRYVLNQISSMLADAPAAPAADPEALGPKRLALIDAIASFLRVVAETQPLVLLFDDLHLVSRPSLLVLELLARGLGRTAMLIVATHREGDVATPGHLGARLGDLPRGSTSVPLRELDSAGVRALAASLLGREPSARLTSALHDLTGGNPLLLELLLRHLTAGGCDERSLMASGVSAPKPARIAVRNWLAALTAESRRALETASVVGREFDAEIVAKASQMSKADADAALALAAGAGLVRATAADTFRFRHGMACEAIATDLPEARRRSLHDAVGSALEDRHCGRLEAALPALAHHFFEGNSQANAARARSYLQRAGRHALEHHAYEEAAGQFERALPLLAPHEATSEAERGAIQLWRTRALVRAGELERATHAAREAAVSARRVGSGTLLAHAALALRRADGPDADAPVLALLEESRTLLPATDDPLRVRIDASLARQLALQGERERSEALSRAALERARAVGDLPTLALALAKRSQVLRAASAQDEERVALSAELFERAQRSGDRELLMEAHQCRMADSLTFSDPAFHAAIRAARRISEGLRQPYYDWQVRLWRGMRANLVGEFERAKRHAAEAFRIGNRVRPLGARIALTIQTMVRLWQQGEATRLSALVDGFMAEHGEAYPECRVGRIWALANGERRGDAARTLAALAADNFRAVPVTQSWDVVLALLADSAAMLKAGEHAPGLYDRLRPYAGRVVVLGAALECLGPTDRYLGLLAALRQDWEAAEAHFVTSLEISRRLAALPFIARTLQNHAAMLCMRGRTADAPRAAAMLAQSLAVAVRFGMAGVAQEAIETQALLRVSAASGAVAAGQPTVHSLSREGDQWTFCYRGDVSRIRDRAGMRYLATLLERPHEKTAAVRMTHEAARGLPPLQAGRQPAATRAGRGRSVASVERMRVRVTRALREIIKQISAADAHLGAHLVRSVLSGRFCCYDPPDGSTWVVTRDEAQSKSPGS